MKKSLLIALVLLPLVALGQTNSTEAGKQPTIVSLTAKSTDVRAVIADLFAQAKQNYVLQPGIQFALFLQLDKVEFEEALAIVCKQAQLQFEVQNGIFYVTKKSPVIASAIPPKAKGPLDPKVLDRHVTTNLAKTDIKAVFAELGKQTHLTIEVDKSVPAYKLDARLTDITLKGALEKVTVATGLKYKLTNNFSILVFKPEDPNKIAISGG